MSSKREPVNIQISKEFVREDFCIWKGKPEIVPYLLINYRMFSMTIALVLVLCYMKFHWNIVTIICTVFYGIHIISGVVDWSRVRYYITDSGPCIKKNGLYYQLNWRELSKADCRILKNPVDVIFGCRTVQFAVQYGYTGKRGSNTNLLRNTARFWCIREYGRVEELMGRYGYTE